MEANETSPDAASGGDKPTQSSADGRGPALRRAWLGYQHRLDAAMADAGFGERKVPDGRVLRLCSDQAGATISPVGRELGICHLRDLGYVVIADSPTSKWEKSVVLTARGINYLRVKQTVARAIEVGLRAELGEAAFSGLVALLDVLGTGEQEGLRTYLQRSAGTY